MSEKRATKSTDKNPFRISFIYDPFGNLVEEQKTIETGHLFHIDGRSVHRYEKNNRSETIYYTGESAKEFGRKLVYYYDNLGKRTHFDLYKSNTSEKTATKYLHRSYY